ncbi:hypothetical protein K438DRAFT_1988861 [Mycena galopus ATCC 62051]|nr:hypothetical protein K438DRAFT_1988861 [Mycena galopus ATCC 62051]
MVWVLAFTSYNLWFTFAISTLRSYEVETMYYSVLWVTPASTAIFVAFFAFRREAVEDCKHGFACVGSGAGVARRTVLEETGDGSPKEKGGGAFDEALFGDVSQTSYRALGPPADVHYEAAQPLMGSMLALALPTLLPLPPPRHQRPTRRASDAPCSLFLSHAPASRSTHLPSRFASWQSFSGRPAPTYCMSSAAFLLFCSATVFPGVTPSLHYCFRCTASSPLTLYPPLSFFRRSHLGWTSPRFPFGVRTTPSCYIRVVLISASWCCFPSLALRWFALAFCASSYTKNIHDPAPYSPSSGYQDPTSRPPENQDHPTCCYYSESDVRPH